MVISATAVLGAPAAGDVVAAAAVAAGAAAGASGFLTKPALCLNAPMKSVLAKMRVKPPMATAMMTFSRDQMEEPECSDEWGEWLDIGCVSEARIQAQQWENATRKAAPRLMLRQRAMNELQDS